ncbi:hypothetical protein AMAG_10558 [Allomyces macrogynus ATCC 38327]|uniref:Protein PBN1 n=1 Tax=Allomyces macrogynus (strain ATCC 38327) TaxID=578462 RepID=A0A0L0SV44_ALLM3|nr:hypothetical protein AMAG_10558 [Allomyces macrogynus ATCC 38327]|eukprot:KNE66336.1 hypothetical protein AMAG_10558 [Allomyces macrogynus ATCC 38327]
MVYYRAVFAAAVVGLLGATAPSAVIASTYSVERSLIVGPYGAHSTLVFGATTSIIVAEIGSSDTSRSGPVDDPSPVLFAYQFVETVATPILLPEDPFPVADVDRATLLVDVDDFACARDHPSALVPLGLYGSLQGGAHLQLETKTDAVLSSDQAARACEWVVRAMRLGAEVDCATLAGEIHRAAVNIDQLALASGKLPAHDNHSLRQILIPLPTAMAIPIGALPAVFDTSKGHVHERPCRWTRTVNATEIRDTVHGLVLATTLPSPADEQVSVDVLPPHPDVRLVASEPVPLRANLTARVLDTSMHPTVHLVATTPTPPSDDGHWRMTWALPPGVFLDPYQVAGQLADPVAWLAHKNATSGAAWWAWYSATPELEQHVLSHAARASVLVVDWPGASSATVPMEVPLHVRYAAPVSGGGYSDVDLGRAVLAWVPAGCDDGDWAALVGGQCTRVAAEANTVAVRVPRADLDDAWWVEMVTVAVIGAGALVIVVAAVFLRGSRPVLDLKSKHE